jgi:sugar transferase (PEP-CTERM/EpsH1 system associated)
MGDILFLVHRIPYPPDKGDKIRSWNILRHLLKNHRVHLGCFIDDARDWQFTDTLREMVASAHFSEIKPKAARIRGLVSGLTRGEALSLGYFRDKGMKAWVDTCLKTQEIDHVVVFSSPMAQYVLGQRAPIVIDFVDVDSDKWTQYATHKKFPEKWIYAREARTLLAFERRAAAAAKASLFVSPAEADLFRKLAPEVAASVHPMNNGVDLDYFSPDHAFEDVTKHNGPVIAFTGAMDYWANVDAVRWFANEVWPTIRKGRPDAAFYIVGGNPTPDVKELAKIEGVTVTGRVEDVRPFIARADVVVAPMRIARGVQNKVLEGMAMARPVVTTSQGLEGIDATPGRDLVLADGAEAFAEAVRAVLDGKAEQALGERARQRMVEHYSWDASLSVLDRFLA